MRLDVRTVLQYVGSGAIAASLERYRFRIRLYEMDAHKNTGDEHKCCQKKCLTHTKPFIQNTKQIVISSEVSILHSYLSAIMPDSGRKMSDAIAIAVVIIPTATVEKPSCLAYVTRNGNIDAPAEMNNICLFELGMKLSWRVYLPQLTNK